MSADEEAPTEWQHVLVRSALHVVDECAADLARRWPKLIKSPKEMHAEGVFALYRVAARYSEELNRDFVTYARHRVRGAMRDTLRMERFQERLQRAAEAAVDLRLAEHCEPEINPFVHEEGDARRRLRDFASGLFTATFVAGMDAVMREQGEDGQALRREYAAAIDALRRALAMLEPQENQVLVLVYGHENTLEEAAVRLGIPYITARRRHARALERLLKYLTVMGVTRAPPAMHVPGVATALPANDGPEPGQDGTPT